ncbi:TPA: hypothetical protein ACOA1Y_003479 [Vibrio cholerae]
MQPSSVYRFIQKCFSFFAAGYTSGAGPQVQPALSAGGGPLPWARRLAAAPGACLDPAADTLGGTAPGGIELHPVRAVPVPARQGGQHSAGRQRALDSGDPAGGLVGAASGELTRSYFHLQGRLMASFLSPSCMSDVALLIEHSRACSLIWQGLETGSG